MTIFYIDTVALKAEVIDSITEQSVILFRLSKDSIRSIMTTMHSEGIHFATIPIGMMNGTKIFIGLNNMDEILSIIQLDILTRDEVNKINILYENVCIN